MLWSMRAPLLRLVLLSLLDPITLALPQGPGHIIPVPASTSGRKLTGKFLHITDVHPDPYYKTYSSVEEDLACHRGKGSAGIYGAETTSCDSPISLIDQTFKWINDTIRDEIDFIIWTGDSARHDNDEKIPRSEKQVVKQNELLVKKFLSVFGKPKNWHDDDPTNDFTIPIVPNFGNNDILPHNVFTEGPNRWTRRFLTIWRQFIPEEQRHQFQRGGWFFVEVIPKKLAVISLNTLYFFESNPAVDGCAMKSQPGYEHMEWLRIQLQLLRERGMKAILIGHVPPARVDSKISWDETCWQKYALWMRQYRDIVVASMYGHMNMDHFMLQDFHDIKKHVKKGVAIANTKEKSDSGDEYTITGAEDYLVDLRNKFAKIPSVSDNFDVEVQGENEDDLDDSWTNYFQSILKRSKKSRKQHSKKKTKPDSLSKIGGEYGERYSMSLVAASIVPNYLPAMRIYKYNITGLEDSAVASSSSRYPATQFRLYQSPLILDEAEAKTAANELAELQPKKESKEHANKHKKPKRHKFKIPKGPSKSSPPGPAYSPQTFTLLGYTQYYANLTHINNDFLDTKTGKPDIIASLQSSREESADSRRWKEGHHHKKVKHGKPHPKKFQYLVEYDTFNDKVFGLKDLTVRSYIRLAKQIAQSKKDGKSNSYEEEEEAGLDEIDKGAANTNEDVDTEGKHKKKKKKHDKKKRKKRLNKVWFTFVQRAFVGTMDSSEIESQFGDLSERQELRRLNASAAENPVGESEMSFEL